MSVINTCPRCEMVFKDWLKYDYHVRNFKHEYVKMDEYKKVEIRERLEKRLGLHHFIGDFPALPPRPLKLTLEVTK